MNKPTIRFKGFEGEWKKVKIGDVAPLTGGFAFQSGQFKTLGVPIIRISNILSSGIVGGDFVYYNEFKGDSEFRLYKGDVVIAMSGATTGKVATFEANDFGYQNQRVGKFSRTNLVNYELLSKLVSAPNFQKKIISKLTSSAQPNASSKDIDSIDLVVPEETEEQRALASYFTSLDAQIAASTSRLSSLKQIKAASLLNMFPQKGETVPRVRFKGFQGEWKERKLGEIAIVNPKCDLPKSFEYVDLESVVGTEMKSHRREFRESAPSRAQRLARKGDIFYQTVRPYQKNNYLFNLDYSDYVFSSGYAQIQALKDERFLFTVVQSDYFLKQVMDNCTGTSFPSINPTLLRNLIVYDCSIDEQRAIGQYFTALDAQITLHRERLEKLKQIKAACLERMFA